jgi:tetratricopeptide (TPR) repeat protein
MRARPFRFVPLFLLAALPAGCGWDAGPSVDLPAFRDTITDGPLRTQIGSFEERVRRLEAEGAPAPELAAAVGELGRLYHGLQLLEPEALQMLENALACYRAARRIDDLDWRWPYLEAFALATQGELAEAADGYREALDRSSGMTVGLLRLAEVERRLGRFEAAESLWNQALETEPDQASALLGLGRIALDRGDFASASAFLEQVVELVPEAGQAHHALGLAYRNLGSVEAAERHLGLASEAGVPLEDRLVQEMTALPVGSRALLRRGLLAVQAGALEAAVGLLRSATEQDPANLLAHRNLALAQMQAGMAREAAATLAGLAELDASDAWARVELGRLLSEEGRLDLALPHLQQAVDLAPDYLAGRLQLGLALVQRGEAATALTHFEAAIELDPYSAEARVQYAAALAAAGRPDIGIRVLRERLAQAPADAGAARFLSRILRQQQRLGEAQTVLERSLEGRRGAPGEEGALRLELGRILALRGDPARAFSQLAQARRLAPDLFEAGFLAGLVAAQLGNLDYASDAYTEVLGARPDFVPARLGLAEVLERLGRCADAVELLEEGQRLRPGERTLDGPLARLRAACAGRR